MRKMISGYVFCACVFMTITTITIAARPYINDSACPRKPELSVHRKCLKKCRTDLDCRGRNRQCLCDDVCGKACVKPSQRCEGLKPILNGKYTIDSSNVFGARIRYSCDKHHVLRGDRERICQGDGYWSGTQPKCEEEGHMADHAMVPELGKCQDPPEVLHAHHDGHRGQKIFPLGTQLNYICEDGYNIDGFFRSMCVGDGRWVGPRMTCSPRRCGHPGDVQNGAREGSIFVYPSRVRYVCTEGYEMLGRSFRVCMANGKWSGALPTCIPIKCPRMDAPTNGEMLGTDNTYGATTRFSCSKGFDLKGSRVRRCEHSGRWSGDEVKCSQVDCGQPGPFYNGFLDGGTTTYGSEYQFRCFGWTTFEGPSLYTTCQENGLWSHPVPKCWARCTYPHVLNGTINKSEGSDDYGTHGQLLNVTCAAGHALNTTQRASCHNGTWTFVPECIPAPCESRPREIREGYVRFYTMEHGDKAKYKCNTGYKLDGDQYVTCQYGKWTGRQPRCIQLYCDYPGTVDHGQVMLVGAIGKYEYRPYVRKTEHNKEIEFHCSKEYRRVGPAAATCVDGEWSPHNEEFPKCVPKQHPKLLYLFRGKRSLGHRDRAARSLDRNELTYNGITYSNDKGFCEVPSIQHSEMSSLSAGFYAPHDSVLEVQCAEGYRVAPPGEQNRCDDGVWTTHTECIIERCTYPDVENGIITKNEEHVEYGLENDVINVTCAQGYVLNTSDEGRCHRGTWTLVPECTPAPCEPRPVETPDGHVTSHGHGHGDEMTYTCVHGYQLEGEEVVTCQYGEWTAPEPQCAPRFCPHPGFIENGLVLLIGLFGKYIYRSYVTHIEDGQQIEFLCSKEYYRVGPAGSVCVNSTWTHHKLPLCIPKDDPKVFNTPEKRTVKRDIEQVKRARASQSYVTYDGVQYNNDKGYCEVPVVPHAKATNLPTGYYVTHNSVLRVTCARGYKTDQSSEADTCDDGTWTKHIHCESDDVFQRMEDEESLISLAESVEGGAGRRHRHSASPVHTQTDQNEAELLSVRHAQSHRQVLRRR